MQKKGPIIKSLFKNNNDQNCMVVYTLLLSITVNNFKNRPMWNFNFFRIISDPKRLKSLFLKKDIILFSFDKKLCF